MTTMTDTTVQVYRVFIKAAPQAIWDAITTPEWTQRYGYTGLVEYELRPGGTFRTRPTDAMRAGAREMGYDMPDVILDGEVIEADPPHKLVQTWRMLMDPAMAAEGFTRVTYEIAPGDGGVSTLTVIHDLAGAPALAAVVGGEKADEGAGGGWAFVLSDLKTLLETGASFNE